jgi:hypothetical protein
MCERKCPYCRSTEHFHSYGVVGIYIACCRCQMVLASRRDIEAARTDLTEEEAEAWQTAGSGVLKGAEAINPVDDEIYGPNRWTMESPAPPNGWEG